MVIELEPLFMEHFQKCPLAFQEKFRKAYQLLKIADHPLDIKGIKASSVSNKMFKLLIDKSRISLQFNNGKLKVVCFLFNQFRSNI